MGTKLELALDVLQEPVFVYEPVRGADGAVVDLRCEYMNRAAAELVGLPMDAVVGRQLFEVFPTLRDAGLFELYLEVIESRAGASLRIGDLLDSSSERAFDLVVGPIGDGVIVSVRDVSEQAAAERALAESEAQYRLLAENAADFVLRFTPDMVIDWASPSIEDVLGWRPDEVVGMTPVDLTAPDAAELTRATVERVTLGLPSSGRRRLRCKNGSFKWIDRSVRPVLDADGNVVAVVSACRDIQPVVDANKELLAVQANFRRLAENSAGLVFQSDLSGRLEWVSPSVTEILGWTPEELVGRLSGEILHPDDVPGMLAAADLISVGSSAKYEGRFRKADATYVWMSINARPVLDFSGNVIGRIGSAVDISAEVAARRELAASADLFRTAMTSAAFGVALVDLTGVVLATNSAFCSLLDYPATDLQGQRLLDLIHPDDVEFVRPVGRRLLDGETDTDVGTIRFIRRDGSVVWTRRSTGVVRDADQQVQMFLLQVEDLTRERNAEEALAFSALHDDVTGLRSRTWLLDTLTSDLEAARREGSRIGVLFIDLDNFRLVNESMGHAVGDQLLRNVGRVIAEAVSDNSRVARFGGDEFVVVVPAAEGEQRVNREAVAIRAALSRPIALGETEVLPTASIGISLSRHDSTPLDLMREADSALAKAKADGKGRIRHFDERLHESAVRRLQLERELRRALDSDEFVVHYQPILSLTDGSLSSYEALVRWHHPAFGLLGPGEFLPIAEESGLLGEIGDVVLDKVCRLLATRHDVTVPIGVNKSPSQLTRVRWQERFFAILDRHGVDPSRLVIEITETAIFDLIDNAAANLRRARDAGIGVLVDDFGTGFSSVSLLRDLPITGLKLDMSFTRHLVTDERARGLAQGLAGLTRGLELEGIAEGIETAEQAELLAVMGWGLGQGNLLGTPRPEIP